MDYTVFRNGGADIAGMMAVPHPGIPPHWGTYFTVNDADEAARVAEELGATLFVPPDGHPGHRPLLRHHLAAGRQVLRDQVSSEAGIVGRPQTYPLRLADDHAGRVLVGELRVEGVAEMGEEVHFNTSRC